MKKQNTDFREKKIQKMVRLLKEKAMIDEKDIDFGYIECGEYKKSNTPPALSDNWRLFLKGARLEGVDRHFWLHLKIDAVEKQDGKELRFSLKTGREGQWDPKNPQCIVYVNGKTEQAFDTNHTWLPLEFETDYDIYIYLYTGMIGGYFDVLPSIQIIDLAIEGLFYDINVPYLCMEEYKKDDYNYIKIRDCLDKALVCLDLREIYSEEFYESVRKTSEYLRDEFYGKLCGENDICVSCIGHTHIDIAWQWTVAQTKEKAQRTFSTVINMMKRYEEYSFMSSQPQLYQYVKENDPELYEKIKEKIKEGRWEPEGGMWIEADTNLVSGESLIRQIIFGKRFMKEEFGKDSRILWLPDVFGYSGALPQIMKKSGIDYFFTSKMAWNRTNAMPNDIFLWEGIDGSKVFANLLWNYAQHITPDFVLQTWEKYKNKSYNDNPVMTFGYGDGGGGPTYEMMENYRRLKYGLPGMPKVKLDKAEDYFEKTEEKFYKNSEELCRTPKWVGEMYFEMHRGTYTSMAKNKKNNRMSELLYLKAEALSVADMILCGGVYPEENLRKNQQTILLNQFHDIIPGSSIKEVYDVTDLEYEQILSDANKIAEEKLNNIKADIATEGGIWVYNATPFEVSDYIKVDGELYFAQDIPAHGWRVIDDKPVKWDIKVSKNCIENDCVKVLFDESYHIISIYDKIEKREVIAEGEKANCIEIFEDYPNDYDAWEICDYYRQKMWIADDVSKVTLLENGIRVERKYRHSKITQDITVRNGSKRIDFATTVDWQEDHVMMKAAFPTDIHSQYATYDIQFGNLERPTHKNTSWDEAKFEVCAHKWADLSESGFGVSLLNDCKYGYSIEDNVMEITLLKSATYPNPVADRGINTFTYSLYPHTGDYRRGKTVREGYILNQPLSGYRIEKNTGAISDCCSIAKSDCENVVVETIKKAEDDSSVIVRLYETYNQKSDAQISVGFDFKEVYLCDMLENNLEKIESENNAVKIKVKNFEIITLKFII